MRNFWRQLRLDYLDTIFVLVVTSSIIGYGVLIVLFLIFTVLRILGYGA